MDLLVKDLDKEMQEAEVEEKEAQKEYEQMMADSAEKRAEDSKALTDKERAKADAESMIVRDTELKKETTKQFLAAGQYQSQLHGECDWLMSNYDLRKEARDEEVEGLKSSVAVLSGADFAFVQKQLTAHHHD